MTENTAKTSKPANTNRPVTTVTATRLGAKKLVAALPSITNNATSSASNASSNHTRTRRFFNCHAREAPAAHAAPTRNCQARVSGLKNANDSASILIRSINEVPDCVNSSETGNMSMSHQENARLLAMSATAPRNTLRLRSRAVERCDRATMSAITNGNTK